MSPTSAPPEHSVPAGTALLCEVLEVPVEAVSLSGRRPIVLPDIPVEGYGAKTWHAFATLLVARVTDLEEENAALRAGAMHPTARELLELFLARIDEALPHLAPARCPITMGVDSTAAPEAASDLTPSPSAVEPAPPTPDQDLAVVAGPGADTLPGVTAEAVAAVAGTRDGVDFWDEADTHGLLGRLRRRRSRGRAASTGGPDGLADAA